MKSLKSLQYEDRVICFLDILGFKNIIEKTLQDKIELENLLTTYNNIYLFEVNQAKKEKKLGIVTTKQITHFSDSLVISFKIEERGQLFFILNNLKILNAKIVQHGYLTRGAITYGKCIHTNEILIGPAIIRAYKLESEKAIYPRIILDPKIEWDYIIKANKHHPFNEEKKYIESNITIDDKDKYFYIDYFQKIDVEFDNLENYFIYLNNLKNIIIEGIKSENDKIREKYEWMKEKYNNVISKLKKHNYNNCFWEYIQNLTFID